MEKERERAARKDIADGGRGGSKKAKGGKTAIKGISKGSGYDGPFVNVKALAEIIEMAEAAAASMTDTADTTNAKRRSSGVGGAATATALLPQLIKAYLPTEQLAQLLCGMAAAQTRGRAARRLTKPPKREAGKRKAAALDATAAPAKSSGGPSRPFASPPPTGAGTPPSPHINATAAPSSSSSERGGATAIAIAVATAKGYSLQQHSQHAAEGSGRHVVMAPSSVSAPASAASSMLEPSSVLVPSLGPTHTNASHPNGALFSRLDAAALSFNSGGGSISAPSSFAGAAPLPLSSNTAAAFAGTSPTYAQIQLDTQQHQRQPPQSHHHQQQQQQLPQQQQGHVHREDSPLLVSASSVSTPSFAALSSSALATPPTRRLSSAWATGVPATASAAHEGIGGSQPNGAPPIGGAAEEEASGRGFDFSSSASSSSSSRSSSSVGDDETSCGHDEAALLEAAAGALPYRYQRLHALANAIAEADSAFQTETREWRAVAAGLARLLAIGVL